MIQNIITYLIGINVIFGNMMISNINRLTYDKDMNIFDIFEISHSNIPDNRTIKMIYHRLSKIYHPDTRYNNRELIMKFLDLSNVTVNIDDTTEYFTYIQNAYEILIDQSKLNNYMKTKSNEIIAKLENYITKLNKYNDDLSKCNYETYDYESKSWTNMYIIIPTKLSEFTSITLDQTFMNNKIKKYTKHV